MMKFNEKPVFSHTDSPLGPLLLAATPLGLAGAWFVHGQRDTPDPAGWTEHPDHPVLREAVDQIANGVFSRGDRDLFRPLVDALTRRDEYLAFADFGEYASTQWRVATTYRDTRAWTRMSILNVARTGRFSSDRSIREYAERIWKTGPVAPAE